MYCVHFHQQNLSVQWTVCYMGCIPVGQRKLVLAHSVNVVVKNYYVQYSELKLSCMFVKYGEY
jgi:hypothetical protein